MWGAILFLILFRKVWFTEVLPRVWHTTSYCLTSEWYTTFNDALTQSARVTRSRSQYHALTYLYLYCIKAITTASRLTLKLYRYKYKINLQNCIDIQYGMCYTLGTVKIKIMKIIIIILTVPWILNIVLTIDILHCMWYTLGDLIEMLIRDLLGIDLRYPYACLASPKN